MLGTIVGLLAGYYRGWTDTLLSRLVDVVLAIPVLLLGLGLGAACEVRGCLGGHVQSGLGVIIFLIALVNWTYIARIVRGLVLSLREQEFVVAARSQGASDARIMGREILPNLLAPIVVYASLLIPQNILLRGGAVVPRRGCPPAHRQLGADDRRRHADVQHGLVVHGLPRDRPAVDGARLQPARRRPAGRSQPEDRAMTRRSVTRSATHRRGTVV